LIVAKLDRLARSTCDLLNTLDAIGKAGATFKSFGGSWANTDTRSATRQFRGSEGVQRLNSFDRPQFPEKVLKMFVLIRQQLKELSSITSLRLLNATILLGNVGPNLGGGSGDGDPRSGPGSLGGEPASIYIGSNVRDIDISQLNQRVLSCTDDVAL
jgi:resolvase-like protein